MSKVDLDAKAKQAFDDVSNSKLTYALLKHEGTSNKVIVASTGDDIMDLIDDLNDGTIMYALIRFVINDATKFVYVGWCPEGIANQIFKGKFQNWNKDMEFYLKGRYHLSVYARNEEDIDQASWIKKLKISAGSSYTQSSNAKDLTITQAKQNIASSKTDVRKTEVGIDESERNKFWEKQQEELKKQEEKKKLPPPRSDYKKTDERNQFWQGQSTSTTTSGSTVVKSSDRISEIQQIKSNSNQFWQKQQQQETVQEENKPKEVVRGNKDLFKKFETMSVKTEEPKPVARQPISTGAAKKPVFQPKHEEPVYEEPQQHYHEEPSYEEPQHQYHEEPQQEEEPAYEPPQQTYQQPRVPPPFHQPRYDSEEEEEEEEEHEPEPVHEPVNNNKPTKPKGYLERQVEQGNISPSQAEEIIAKPTKLPPPPVPSKPKLPELVAVYDFDGQDGEELTFHEGDTLYLVQDEGEWWLAENTSGQQGYIPSNYVEMKEW